MWWYLVTYNHQSITWWYLATFDVIWRHLPHMVIFSDILATFDKAFGDIYHMWWNLVTYNHQSNTWWYLATFDNIWRHLSQIVTPSSPQTKILWQIHSFCDICHTNNHSNQDLFIKCPQRNKSSHLEHQPPSVLQCQLNTWSFDTTSYYQTVK